MKFKKIKEAGHRQSNPTHSSIKQGARNSICASLLDQAADHPHTTTPPRSAAQTTLIPPHHPDQQAHHACYIFRATPRVLAASVSTRLASSSRKLFSRLGREASKRGKCDEAASRADFESSCKGKETRAISEKRRAFKVGNAEGKDFNSTGDFHRTLEKRSRKVPCC